MILVEAAEDLTLLAGVVAHSKFKSLQFLIRCRPLSSVTS